MAPVIAVPNESSMMSGLRRSMRVLDADRCARCHGLMIAEWSDDLSEYVGRRCVQCGEVIDPVILHNRWLQQAGASSSS
jgi:hypothetical protein